MTFTFLKPVKAQKAFRLINENVRRYRAGQLSYPTFYYRACKLWMYVQHAGFDAVVTPAYMKAMCA